MKKLGFGLMRLPVINGDSKAIDIPTVKKMVDKFMENGFTYFDTAAPYHNGMSEMLSEKPYPKGIRATATRSPTNSAFS